MFAGEGWVCGGYCPSAGGQGVRFSRLGVYSGVEEQGVAVRGTRYGIVWRSLVVYCSAFALGKRAVLVCVCLQ